MSDDGTLAALHNAADLCLPCDVLGTTSNTGASGGGSGCVVCPAGTYGDEPALYPCKNCLAGRYLSDDGTSAALHNIVDLCLPCDVLGTTSNKDATGGGSGCVVCPAGTYSDVPALYPCKSCMVCILLFFFFLFFLT